MSTTPESSPLTPSVSSPASPAAAEAGAAPDIFSMLDQMRASLDQAGKRATIGASVTAQGAGVSVGWTGKGWTAGGGVTLGWTGRPSYGFGIRGAW